jgi:hypothetical protein
MLLSVGQKHDVLFSASSNETATCAMNVGISVQWDQVLIKEGAQGGVAWGRCDQRTKRGLRLPILIRPCATAAPLQPGILGLAVSVPSLQL